MQPLLKKATVNEANFLGNAKSKPLAKYLCIGVIFVFIVVISILSYFNFGASHLSSNNPAKSLFEQQTSALDESEPIEYYKSSGEDDIITSLPNLDISTCTSSVTNCEFNQYSGYLLANDNREIHYWFIEADTTDDTTKKPLLFWTNGGPGCSGLMGLLTEQGPWRVMDNLDIHYDPYSWNKEVNLVFLEQPYGVGFSEATDGDFVVGDQNAADDMDAAIRNFFIKFPQYADTRTYISSESWGGHYVPMTTLTILENNEAGYTPHINFGGFLLGNPYTQWYENLYGFVGSLYGHGFVLNKDWEYWRDNCWDNEENIDTDVQCAVVYDNAYISSENANVYALDYPQCKRDEYWGSRKNSHMHHHAQIFMKRVLDYHDYDALNMGMDKEELTVIYNNLMNRKHSIKALDDDDDDDDDELLEAIPYLPCLEYNMDDYLNLKKVQTALHVKPLYWEVCNDPVWEAWPDSDYYTYMQPIYNDIITQYLNEENLRLCIYSGDDDSVCGLQGTQYWLDRWEGYEANPEMEWVAWEDDDVQLGGFYTQYLRNDDPDSGVALHLVTVRTAGHMVPTTEPSRSLTVLRKFLYEM